jgi:HEPN domain-containing protein
MLLLHHRLHDIAESELKAANALTNNSFYPQAVYFYEQAFEKAAKSIVALYLIKFKKFLNPKYLDPKNGLNPKYLKNYGSFMGIN